MGLPEIFTLISALFEFPKTILEFVKILKKTPVENHEDVLQAMAKEAKRFEDTGRPT